ncbi:hypothetical protein G7Y89_g396 [Cudoniella acicularis]|uniref:Uncharacterized protein n=1 Tax=Cudoniella acicularis TaxID=354080 RepID=A0A8H4RZZ3_9HELO|nr:hypothetical protein G7Y89_g396 [Cudoniella acicularis]
MGLSCAFGCFKDPEARTRKKQKKAGKRTHHEEARPNRVIAAARRDGQAETEMRNLPDQSSLPATVTMQNCEPPPSAPGDDDNLEPWSVGSVIRRTSLLQARLSEMTNERKQTGEEADVSNSKANHQATVEEEVEMPTIQTKPEAIAKEMGDNETSWGEIPSTVNMSSYGDGGGGGGKGIIRATMMFGLPTASRESEADLRVIEEEAAARKFMEENNAIAGKGSHNGKYGGAVGWNARYSQRTTTMPLYSRDMRKSGWGWAGPYAYVSGPAN